MKRYSFTLKTSSPFPPPSTTPLRRLPSAGNCGRRAGSLWEGQRALRMNPPPSAPLTAGGRAPPAGPPPELPFLTGRWWPDGMRSRQEVGRVGRRGPSPGHVRSLPISSLESRFGNIRGFSFSPDAYIGAWSIESHDQLSSS